MTKHALGRRQKTATTNYKNNAKLSDSKRLLINIGKQKHTTQTHKRTNTKRHNKLANKIMCVYVISIYNSLGRQAHIQCS